MRGRVRLGVEGVAGAGGEVGRDLEAGGEPERVGEFKRHVVVRGVGDVRARLLKRGGHFVWSRCFRATELEREGHAACGVAARAGL